MFQFAVSLLAALVVSVCPAVAADDAPSLKPAWQLDLRALGGRALVALHTVGDLVVVEDEAAGLTALDARSGHVRWFVQHSGPIDRRPLPADGRAVFAASTHVIVVDLADGSRLVDRHLPTVPAGSPIATRHALFVPSLDRDALVAYDLASPRELWNFPMPGRLDETSALVEFADSQSILLRDAGRLRLVPATAATPRREIWVRTSRPLVGRPLVEDGRLVLVDRERTVSCLDAGSGSAHWTTVLPTEIEATPARAGSLFVVPTRDGLHALDAEGGREVWHVMAEERPVGGLGGEWLLVKRPGGERAVRRLSDSALVAASVSPGAAIVDDVLVEWTDSVVSGRRLTHSSSR